MSVLSFTSDNQRSNFELVLSALAEVGYSGDLVKKDYRFLDGFAAKPGASRLPQRSIDAALFGRAPVAYETALVGVAMSNGESGAALANANRALGAPLIVEVGERTAATWAVGHDADLTRRITEVAAIDFRAWVQEHRQTIGPAEFLRAKNVGTAGPQFYQPSLFAGLIPELEENIASILGPRLTRAFAAGLQAYKEATGNPPRESKLFQLAFWLLTGKVFCDRKHSKFVGLSRTSGADEVLNRVAEHYKREPENLLNRQARDAVFNYIWSKMDFQNLSVEVLSQLWSTTLVTPETRKKLGIHRTRRSLVRYIIDRIPFGDFAPDDRYIFEPCSGSAGFLIAAMERMHDLLPAAGHAYFRKRLSGMERDPFGIEISKLCLSLADYPNPNGWNISPSDVFQPDAMKAALAKARVVLCNPPFEKFSESQRKRYGAEQFNKPAELLRRVLEMLRPDAVLGFVLPRTFLDGQDYREVRPLLVSKFRDVDIVALPDKGWDFASKETVLLIATRPQSGGSRARVTQARVREADWTAFDLFQHVRSRDTDEKNASESRNSLAVPELRNVWEHLEYCDTLGSVAKAHKGIEWNLDLERHYSELISETPFPESRIGVPPQTKFESFQAVPSDQLRHLNFSQKLRRREFDRPWDQPKVIMNKTTRSREMWRVAAFADFRGLAFFETYFGIWPDDPKLTQALSAVLNGPIANAYLAVHRGKLEFTIKTVHDIPFPRFSRTQLEEINRLVPEYVDSVNAAPLPNYAAPDRLLKKIDAIVLDAYGLPPKLERQVLDFFNGSSRLVPFDFTDYFPKNFEPYFRLSEWLTGHPAQATAKRFRSQSRDLPDHILAALAATDEGPGDDE